MESPKPQENFEPRKAVRLPTEEEWLAWEWRQKRDLERMERDYERARDKYFDPTWRR